MASKELIAQAAKAMEERRKELIAQPLSRIYPQLAGAAISTILAALQEPTEGMREAGIEAIDDNWERGVTRPAANSAFTCWSAMLNASALGEQSE